jgi:hypothetical protein
MEPEELTPELPLPATVTFPEPTPAPVLDDLVLHDPTALAAQLASYDQSRDLLVAWLKSKLKPGVDWMVIHRRLGRGPNKQDCPNKADISSEGCGACGAKPTLCKPGSEKLCGLLQLRPRFKRDIESWEMLGGEPGLVTLVCELTTAAGVVVAEGRGARHRDQDFGDANKTLKMAAKSAQTDAVLRCAGLSEVFTQDLEDMPIRDADEPDPFEAPRRTAPAPAAPRRAPVEPLQRTLERSVDAASAARRTVAADEAMPRDSLSKPRIGRLYALLHDAISGADVPDDQHTVVFERAREWLAQWVATTQGRPTIAACSYKAYDDLCAQIPAAVEAALQGGARPQPRLVRRRPLH